MKTNNIFILLIAAILLSPIGLAGYMPPNWFTGSVTINGNPAPDGTIIIAKIGGTEVARTTTVAGFYGKNKNFFVDDPTDTRAGQIVEFFVNDINSGQSATYDNARVTTANLAVTIAVAQQPSSSSSGPGGGGAYIPPKTNTTKQNQTVALQNTSTTCTEKWLCTDWSTCTNSSQLQTRTCEDVNKCGTDDKKPQESKPCDISSHVNEAAKNNGFTIPPITAFIVANPAITGGIIIVILIIIYLAWRMLRKKKKQA